MRLLLVSAQTYRHCKPIDFMFRKCKCLLTGDAPRVAGTVAIVALYLVHLLMRKFYLVFVGTFDEVWLKLLSSIDVTPTC